MRPLRCEAGDPHCEGPPAGANPRYGMFGGEGEPMTISAVSLYNAQHPRGYRPPRRLLGLASLPERVVTSRFLGGGSDEGVTANGNEARFADTYNWISLPKGAARGSSPNFMGLASFGLDIGTYA